MNDSSDHAQTGRSPSGRSPKVNYIQTRGDFIGWTPSVLAERTLHRRAVEAAIWGRPLVTFDAMRQAYFRDAGAEYGDVLYWSKPAGWRFQTTTPVTSMNYVLFFVNLKDGPVIVELPPADRTALAGTLVDAWNSPLIDVGDTSEDGGAGAKYLLIPPRAEAPIPAGFIPVRSSTFNVCGVLNIVLQAGSPAERQHVIPQVTRLNIRTLTTAPNATRPRFIDMAERTFEGIAAYDERFYESLARMVSEEPVNERDLAIMGQLRSVGIGTDVKFQPGASSVALLQRAIAEAHAYLADGWRNAGFQWWAGRSWKFFAGKDVITSRGTFLADHRVLLDERAFHSFGAFGTSRNAPTDLFLQTFEDQRGRPLDGSRSYRLHVPAGVPTSRFWSVVVYDSHTAAFIREAPVVGLDSRSQTLKRGHDGAVDVYLGPRPPAGQASNWIATEEERGFFVVFRNFAPDRSVMERTSRWKLSDLEERDTF
jgi:hypothetical protein